MTYVTSSQRPSTQVIQALADAEGVEPTDLPPLYRSIDPDALDRLFRDGRGPGSITFRYLGYRIQITDDGRVELDTAKQEASPRA